MVMTFIFDRVTLQTSHTPRPHYPEKFENSVFTLKTHQMFSVHTTPEEFKNTTTTGHFRFVFEENSGREVT